MKFFFQTLLLVSILPLLTQCETMETVSSDPALPSANGGTVNVDGTIFYPDTADTIYVVGEGDQIIGAGGKNCKYVVENGGSMTAHSGESNQYLIKSGGQFRGFTHPATNCVITYEAGAVVEQEQMGAGTVFKPAM